MVYLFVALLTLLDKHFQLPDITYKVLNLGQKSDIDILCFLHVLKVAESKKVVFKKMVCLYVCEHSRAQTKKDTNFKFGTRISIARGTRHKGFRKIRACAKGTCHRTF